MPSSIRFVAAALAASVAVSLSVPAQAAPADPCIQCGTLYASDPSGNFWILDPDAGTATWIGNLPFPLLNDIGISSDGVLYGLADDELKRIDACAFTGMQVDLVGGNSMGGAITGPELYIIGAPPMAVYDTVADTTTYVGGSLGSDPPDWCGIASGDIVMNPADGLLYATLGCSECPSGDMLVTIDPATGAAVSEIGCVQDPLTGIGYGGLFGLAFDGQCRLFASQSFGDAILLVSTTDASATPIPLVGFGPFGDPFMAGWGLASVPCGPCGGGSEASCDPETHGFWHRECLGADEIDPGRHGGGDGPGPSPRAESYPPTTFAEADADMAPHAIGSCQALDEGPFSDGRRAALRELATIHLNIRAGFLSRSCPVELHPVEDGAGLTVGDAIDLMEARLASGTERDLREARWIGEHVVNGEALR